ncbi:MAG: ubiquinone/menaquinone biosynthesis methyltransferase [Candidatus Latescibacterota bacterium]|nr:ubiquinone/menaquinone biosynthesis methyltransferase [Candidatus Latescibacterota bacterium]
MENKEKIAEHKRRNRDMFNAIARRYDLLNHLLSGGVDIYWRRRALDCVRGRRPQRILDLATGTGDFALAASRLEPQQVVGVDMAIEMLRLGADKVAAKRPPMPLGLLVGDAEVLPFQTGTFDLVMGAFGVRNFGDIPRGLAEAYRVLKPGGEILVLDFCQPTAPLFRQLYLFYFHKVLPMVGGLVSGQRQAYAYLPRSVGDFPQGQAFVAELDAVGFIETGHTPLTLGISAIYQGVKGPVD